MAVEAATSLALAAGSVIVALALVSGSVGWDAPGLTPSLPDAPSAPLLAPALAGEHSGHHCSRQHDARTAAGAVPSAAAHEIPSQVRDPQLCCPIDASGHLTVSCRVRKHARRVYERSGAATVPEW